MRPRALLGTRWLRANKSRDSKCYELSPVPLIRPADWIRSHGFKSGTYQG